LNASSAEYSAIKAKALRAAKPTAPKQSHYTPFALSRDAQTQLTLEKQ
jgi:hypothetical protein